MWSVFLFARKRLRRCFKNCCFVLFVILITLLSEQIHAAEGRAPFASLLAGGLSPVGLGGFYSTPARYADPSYGVSYYWTDDVDESSWNLSLEFGTDLYRVGAFICYMSMDSLYRKTYSEASFAKTWQRFVFGTSYGLDMEWVPGGEFWARHRLKLAFDFKWRELYLAGMLSGYMDEGIVPIVGVHWISEESVSAFAESDFDYLYIGANFRWKFLEISTSYRFPDFAVAMQFSYNSSHYGVSYSRGFKHNSIGWNGVHVSRWLNNERRKIN